MLIMGEMGGKPKKYPLKSDESSKKHDGLLKIDNLIRILNMKINSNPNARKKLINRRFLRNVSGFTWPQQSSVVSKHFLEPATSMLATLKY